MFLSDDLTHKSIIMYMKTRNLKLDRTFIATSLILLVPLIAMQFTSEVDWKLSDFIIIGLMLIGTGLVIEVIIKNATNKRSQLILIGGVILLFLLTWAELAVGIFGSPFAGS